MLTTLVKYFVIVTGGGILSHARLSSLGLVLAACADALGADHADGGGLADVVGLLALGRNGLVEQDVGGGGVAVGSVVRTGPRYVDGRVHGQHPFTQGPEEVQVRISGSILL